VGATWHAAGMERVELCRNSRSTIDRGAQENWV
jgi:hypothetical protein